MGRMFRKTYTRAEFAKRTKILLDDLVADHEEHTGIPDTEAKPFSFWWSEIESVNENTE